MNLNTIKFSLDNPTLARTIARLEMRRGWNEACFVVDRIDHTVDTTSALPKLRPVSGRAPSKALFDAVVDGNVLAVRRALALDASSVNDAIPGMKGKTLLHFAACLHGVRARRSLNEAHAYEEVTAELLAAGADPLARDDTKQFPASYTYGMTPPSLSARMMRAAAEDKVGWKIAFIEPRCRVNATHPWAGHDKGRSTREAKKRGTRAGFRA
jgi:hypothetical protein